MPQHPKQPHLIGIRVDGRIVAAVRAMSVPEARDYYLDTHVKVERLSASEAFRVGQALQVDIEHAKPEYADVEDAPEQTEIFGQQADTTSQGDSNDGNA